MVEQLHTRGVQVLWSALIPTEDKINDVVLHQCNTVNKGVDFGVNCG